MNIITYGTFDLFHYGHLSLLKRSKALGTHLTVAVSTDHFNQTKGKKCIIPQEQRFEIIKSIKYVDRVIYENSWNQKSHDIKKYKIDILTMGDDWLGKFDHLNHLCQVIYLPRTPNISTTSIKLEIPITLSLDHNS